MGNGTPARTGHGNWSKDRDQEVGHSVTVSHNYKRANNETKFLHYGILKAQCNFL